MKPSALQQRYLRLLAFGGAVALTWLLLIPGGGGLLGYSLTRWAMIVVALGLTVAPLAFTRLPFAERVSTRVHRLLEHRWLYTLVVIGCLLVLAATTYTVALANLFTDAAVQAQLARIAPFAFWLGWAALTTLVLLPLGVARDAAVGALRAFPWLPVGIAAGGIALIAGFMLLSRLGLTPDRAGWDTFGAPLLTSQVWLAWLAAIGLSALLSRLPQRRDALAVLLIWAVAMLVWRATPMGPTFFSPRPVAPNFEYYPHSDAALLAVNSESLLIGEGFSIPPEKPLYNLLLAGFVFLGDHDYQATVNIQIVLLALLPAVVYWIGARSGLRLGGLIAAGLIILRESNSISLSGVIGVSHSKLMMTDFPAALGMALVALVFLQWLRHPEDLRWPVFAGGALGLFLLVRSQAVLLAPVVLLGLLIIFWGEWRRIGVMAGVFLLSMFIAILPWMIRNARVTGEFGYSQPFQERYIAGQYSLMPELPRSQVVAEAGFSHVVAFTREHPAYVAGFISAHLLRNELSSLLALPAEFHLPRDYVEYHGLLPYWQAQGTESGLWSFCCGLPQYIERQGYWAFQQRWVGDFPPQAAVPLIFSLAMIAVGIGAAWRNAGWAGLAPLVVHLSYSASTAIARISGWRLILPVDWVFLLYYGLGLAAVTLTVWGYLTGCAQVDETQPSPLAARRSSHAPLWIGVTFLVVGLLVPLSELVIPARYQPLTVEQVVAEYDLGELELGGMSALPGRVLFPRYFPADEGLQGNDAPAFDPLPFNRLGFVLIGPEYASVVLRLDEAPTTFAHAADVIVLGCNGDRYFQALVVILPGDTPAILHADAARSCTP